MYQLDMMPRDTFSVSYNRESLDLGRTADPASPYNQQIALNPKRTRQNTRTHPMLSVSETLVISPLLTERLLT